MTPEEHWQEEVKRHGGSVMMADPVVAIRAAVAEEREACAKLALDEAMLSDGPAAAHRIAAAIRARSQS